MASATSQATDSANALRADLPAAREQLEAQGWCILPDVLDAGAAAHALERLHAAAIESRRHGLPTHMPELDPNASNVRVFYLLERDAVFRDLIRHPDAVALVTALLGKNFLISNFTANIARPGSRSMPLHSDQALVVPEPWTQPWAVNIIWCLTDVTFENGATLYIPGSHHWRTRADVPRDARKLLRPFEAKAGSIIAMDGRVWHTSGANITADQDRALLFGYYAKGFLRSQVNWNAALSPETQAGLDPQMREWLGLEVTANASEALDLLNARREPAAPEVTA
jgi:hypothetical protein